MKKILLTLGLTIFGLNVNSQIEILQEGSTTNIANTTVIHGITGDSQQTINFEVKNLGETADFKIYRRQVDIATGAGDFYCWGIPCFEESEVTPNVAHLSHNETIAEGASKGLITHYVPHGNLGDSRYRYYILNGANNTTIDTLDVFYTTSVSVEDESSVDMNVYPNPAQNEINISIDNSTNGEIVIVDGLGRVVIKENIAGSTKLNISALRNGVYFYSFISEGKSILTKKLIVKR